MPRRRLGVVLLVPEPWATEIQGLRRAVGDDDLNRIPPHITLVPPVNVREESIPDALRVLREAAAATAPFELTLGPPATFLPTNPVLYLAVTGAVEHLTALRSRVFVPPLERSLTWPFVPHATIEDDCDPNRLGDALRVLRDYRVTVHFERVHILEEHGPEHAWRVFADAAFEARRVVGRGGVELELTVTERLDEEAQRFSDREWAAYHGEKSPDTLEVPFAITARNHGDVVGTADGHTRGDDCYLAGLMVAAPRRNEGIGERLVAAVAALAAERDCAFVTLRTQADGDARRFYERLGFVVTGTLPAFRRGRDFVSMRRDL